MTDKGYIGIMESQIEKLYENAGCELGCCKNAEYGYEGEEGTWYYCKKDNKECWTYPNGDADCVEKGYPPFTAEKQLFLFQWVCKKFEEIYISYTDFEEVKSWEIVYKISVHRNSFEECLCAFINLFWQDLTEADKQQIKEILE